MTEKQEIRLNPRGGFWPSEGKVAEAIGRLEEKLDEILKLLRERRVVRGD